MTNNSLDLQAIEDNDLNRNSAILSHVQTIIDLDAIMAEFRLA